jgi:2-oxo-4-hydroxy-4-carboxy-5-ureidoimidazoline decarboxylase
MNPVLEAWNVAERSDAVEAMLACCGARRWADAMIGLRPIATAEELSAAADTEWSKMEEADCLQAFVCHPRIGEREEVHGAAPAAGHAAQSAAWSEREQASAHEAESQVLAELAQGNAEYEQRFGFTYIVCATGKSAEEMLAILKRRLDSDRNGELREAAEQQRLIMQIRLRKWLEQ